MNAFFGFFETHANGIGMAILCLFAVAFFAQWVSWIFGFGRFKRKDQKEGEGKGAALRFVITEAAVKLVNDFRHLLALLIVGIFGGALFYVLGKAHDAFEMWEALKNVTATLGGIVASIIGYYFGEARGRAGDPAAPTPSTTQKAPDPHQLIPPGGSITQVTRPPGSGVADPPPGSG
jgi:hypothetical protein